MDGLLLLGCQGFIHGAQLSLQVLHLLLMLALVLIALLFGGLPEMLQCLAGMLVLFFQGLPVAFFGVNSSSVQMTRLGHKGYPLVLFCRNLTEARAAMCAELFSMFR